MNYEMTKALDEEGIKYKDTSIGTQKLKCPKCQPPHNPRDYPLALTIEDDKVVWYCHHCEYKGGISADSVSYKPKAKTAYNKPTQIQTGLNKDPIYQYFKKRGIGAGTIDDFKIGYENNFICFQYFDVDGSVANIKYRNKDKMFKQTPGTKQILYNYDRVAEAEDIIFVEGEIDVLSLAEVGFVNATTLPGGAPQKAKYDDKDARYKPLATSPLKAKKIILFTDSDGPGKALHQELLHRFGKDLCWYVKTPDNCKDANDVLVKHGKAKLVDLINEAIPYPVDGLYTVRDYFQEIHNLYDGNYVKPTEIGLPGLDDLYKIMTSTFHVVTGIPNHGKSLFLDQILLKLAENHDYKFAIFSPEHSTAMHIRRLVQMYLGCSFDEGFHNRMDKDELNKGLAFINKHFYFIETKDEVPTIEHILSIAKSSILKYGVKGIVIDPFNEVSAVRSAQKREDEHIRDFISLCKRFTRIHEIVCWVVAHPTKLPKHTDGGYQPPTAYDISGAAHWHNQADVVITIHRDFDNNSVKLITRKIREQDLYGKIGEAEFEYDIEKRQYKKKEYKYNSDYDITYFNKDD